MTIPPPPTWTEAIGLTMLGCLLLAAVVAVVVKLAEARKASEFRESEVLRLIRESESQREQAQRDRRQQESIKSCFRHTTHGN